MASDNARHFELRLRKLGLFMLIFSMSGLLFAAFLFGVVVGNDLETYPGKISRQMPVMFLQWMGLSEVEKASPSIVVKSEKAPAKEEGDRPGLVVPDAVSPQSPLTEADVVKDILPTPEQQKVAVLPPPPSADKDKKKTVEAPLVKAKNKEPAADKYVVQITSCKSKKIAEDVVKRIGKIGFKARIVTVEIKDKGTWYRVLLSDLAGKDKANAAADKIDRTLKGNKSVVRIQNR